MSNLLVMNFYPIRTQLMGRALVCRGRRKVWDTEGKFYGNLWQPSFAELNLRQKRHGIPFLYFSCVSLRSYSVFVEDEEAKSAAGKVCVHHEKHERLHARHPSRLYARVRVMRRMSAIFKIFAVHICCVIYFTAFPFNS